MPSAPPTTSRSTCIPFTNLATHPQVDPLVIERGDGIFVEDLSLIHI